jgi:hypothetical protein
MSKLSFFRFISKQTFKGIPTMEMGANMERKIMW